MQMLTGRHDRVECDDSSVVAVVNIKGSLNSVDGVFSILIACLICFYLSFFLFMFLFDCHCFLLLLFSCVVFVVHRFKNAKRC